jgi:hypothetical protein
MDTAPSTKTKTDLATPTSYTRFSICSIRQSAVAIVDRSETVHSEGNWPQLAWWRRSRRSRGNLECRDVAHWTVPVIHISTSPNKEDSHCGTARCRPQRVLERKTSLEQGLLRMIK